MWCAAETVAKACERTGFEIHSHVGNAPMEQLSGVCAVPAYRPPDGQGKKGLKEQDDDMFALTPNFPFTDHTGGATNTYFALTDHLGTVHAFADATGDIVESYKFDAWGNVLGVFDSNGQPISESALGNRYLFQGREYSWATRLYYFRARWYDPVTGRWLSKDPIGISGGLNQYMAFDNNPVMLRDPFGLCTDENSRDMRFLNSLGKTWQLGVSSVGGAGTGGNVSSGLAVSLSWLHGLQIGGYGAYGGGGHLGYSYGTGFEYNVSANLAIAQLDGLTLELGAGGGAVLAKLGGQVNFPIDGAKAAPTVGLTVVFAPQSVTGEAHSYVNRTRVSDPWLNIPNPFDERSVQRLEQLVRSMIRTVTWTTLYPLGNPFGGE
jgi:RHS repeat-associated protein